MNIHTKPVNILPPKCANNDHHLEENTRTLTYTFKFLSLSGIWMPLHWESQKSKKFAYQVFSGIVILNFYILVGLQLMLLFFGKIDLNILVEIMFILIPAIAVCFRIMNFLVRRKQIIELREMLMQDWCEPRDEEERRMQQKTDDFIKNFTIAFNAVGQAVLLVHLAVPHFQELASRKLPVLVWTPYNISDPRNYWIVYSFEIMPLSFAVFIDITVNVIVGGFFLQVCTQLDFLKHRFKQLPDLVKLKGIKPSADELQKTALEQLVQHHDFIDKYAKKVMSIFDLTIIDQYVGSVLACSIVVYQLTFGDVPLLQRVVAFGFFFNLSGEMLIYCWCGNEIALKSSEIGDEIFKMDWMVLTKETKNDLRFIMLRTSKPIVIGYGGLVLLNIESFKAIMTIAYSSLNVLRELTA